MIYSDNFNDIFCEIYEYINKYGDVTNPRELKCTEIICPQIVLSNPLNCLITIKERKLNYAYSIIEKFMYLSGVSYPSIILEYNSNMINFINEETRDFDGAYGLRINDEKVNQFVWCYEKLVRDKDTRQAVITIHNASDCKDSKDITCTLSLQFLIRNNKLNLVCNMRSNDLLWGTCLDFPAFCFLQEVMCSWLKEYYPNLELGHYIHQPASLHYYNNFEDKIKKIVEKRNEVNKRKNPIFNLTFLETNHIIDDFWRQEENIRVRRFYHKTRYPIINEYLEQLLKYWTKKYEKNKE